MRKVTLLLDGSINNEVSENISKSLNALSGIVAATVSLESKTAIVFCGDKLTNETITDCVTKVGHNSKVISEDYMDDVHHLKQNLNL